MPKARVEGAASKPAKKAESSDAKTLKAIVDKFAAENPETWELIRWKQVEQGLIDLCEALD